MAMIVELPNLIIDHQRLLELARFFSRSEGTCLLYSGAVPSQALKKSSKSFLCLFPFEYLEGHATASQNPWDVLNDSLKTPSHPYAFPDWIGFIGYEMGAYAFEDMSGRVEAHSKAAENELPDFYFQRCALILEVNHQDNSARLLISEGKSKLGPLERQWVDSLSDPLCWPGFFKRLGGPPIGPKAENTSFELTFNESMESYCLKVLQAQEWIRAGDIYQLNLSQELIFKGQGDGFQIFEDLANKNPALFSAFLKHKNFTIISSSPEQFLKKQGDILETRPIKGTAPRGENAFDDELKREKLLTSEKERAELLMIVDLMRNDLGKISLPGSVITDEIWGCETYTNVFHLVATIRSRLLPEISPLNALRACFPGGSVTGCPKRKAMDYIGRLESRRRGIYTGSIGYFSGNGNFDFNIAIRTVVQQGDQVNVQLGGAVVIDSIPEMEYIETLHKGESIFKSLHVNMAALIPVRA